MDNIIDEFLNYLKTVKQTSANTESSYRRDLTKLDKYLQMQGIADITKASVTNLQSYMLYLEKAGLIGQLRDATGGIRSLGKVEKIYLNNPALAYQLSGNMPETGTVRETFFYSQLNTVAEVLSSPISDFQINGMTFEVGGRKKGQKQIETVEQGYVVKDDINTGYGNRIPLWMFGLAY